MLLNLHEPQSDFTKVRFSIADSKPSASDARRDKPRPRSAVAPGEETNIADLSLAISGSSYTIP